MDFETMSVEVCAGSGTTGKGNVAAMSVNLDPAPASGKRVETRAVAATTSPHRQSTHLDRFKFHRSDAFEHNSKRLLLVTRCSRDTESRTNPDTELSLHVRPTLS